MIVSLEITEEGACAGVETPPLAVALPAPATEEERTLLGIRQARDLVLAKNRELIDKLAQAEDRIAELTYERDDLLAARDRAEKEGAAPAEEAAELRAEVARLGAEGAALAEMGKLYALARTELEEDLLTLAQERDTALESSRGLGLEIGQLRAELGAARAGIGATGQLAGQLEETVRQLAEARDARERGAAEHATAVAQLTAQVAAAQRAGEEARRELESPAAERDVLQKQAAAEKAGLEARLAALPAPPAAAKKTAPASARRPLMQGPPPPVVRGAAPAATRPKAAPAPALSDQELRSAIEGIHHQLVAVTAAPQMPEVLAKLEAQLRQLAERAQADGFELIHHLTAAASDFAERLRALPVRPAPALAVLERTVEMLGWLGLRGRAEMIETRGALIYAVDDDVDNCECVAMAFEKIALETKYSVRPELALEQITASACELIVLDVDLPGMDGFEVHARIRTLPGRERTPIIFLSGHLSTIGRLATLADEHAEFVAKPYNLNELSLRVLTRIVEARLG